MLRVCDHRNSVGAPRRQELLHRDPENAVPRTQTPTLGWPWTGRRVSPSRRRWHLIPIGLFAGPLRNLSSPSRMDHRCLAEVSSRGAFPDMRRTYHIVPDQHVFPICIGLCWSLSFRRHVLEALQQSTAVRYPALVLGRLCPARFPTRCSPPLPPKPCARRGGP